MALGWLTVLQAVPWSEVIANAPKVADGAKKLWNTVAKKPVPAPAAEAEQAPTALESRLSAMEAAASQMHEQLLASSALIQALAEQNAQLIRRIEANRVRVLWLTAVAVVGVGLGGAALLLPLVSQA